MSITIQPFSRSQRSVGCLLVLLCAGHGALAAPTKPESALQRDPEGVPDYGPTPACEAVGGSAAEFKKRLGRIERGDEPAAPTASSLIESCLVPRDKISRALVRAARVFGKKSNWTAAAAYARVAVEIDLASSEARMVLAATRSRTGDIHGAIYQLTQWKASQKRDDQKTLAVMLWEPSLEALRARRAFWAWLKPPPPACVTALREKPPSLPFKEGKLTFTLPQPVGSREDLVFEAVRLSSANLRVLAQAVTDGVGRPFREYALAKPEDLSDTKIPDASAMTGAYLFRLVPETRLLAVSLAGSFGKSHTIVSILAVEKKPGVYVVAELNCGRCGCHCRDSALRVSRDRRAVAWFKECSDSDPARNERCVVFSENDKLVEKCERLKRNEEMGGDGTMWRACTAGDDWFDADPGDETPEAPPTPASPKASAKSGSGDGTPVPSVANSGGSQGSAAQALARCPAMKIAPVSAERVNDARRDNARGLKALRSRNYDGAIFYFALAVLANPGHLLARYNLACACARAGKQEQALAQLKELSRCASTETGNAGADCKKILGGAGKDTDLESLWSLDEFKKITAAK
jgi:hypothetical protein